MNPGDRIRVNALQVHYGRVLHVGPWEPSAAGPLGRWIRYIDLRDNTERDVFAGRAGTMVEPT